MYIIMTLLFTRLISIVPVTRIVRVIGQPRGNMLLVGIGGSGRQSLTRLSSYIIDYKVFQIEVTKHYRIIEFRDGEWNLIFHSFLHCAHILQWCANIFSRKRRHKQNNEQHK